MRTLYAGGRIHASAGAVAWFKKMGAGWDPDKLDGVAMVAEQIAAKRESDPMFNDLPSTILTRDVITAFAERIEIDEEQGTPKAFYVEEAGPGKWMIIDHFQAAESGVYTDEQEAVAEMQRLNQAFGPYVGMPSPQRINEGLARAYDDPDYLNED